MKQIEINGKQYNVKYTIRALFIWEQITGRSFKMETMLDNYILFYSMILANNPDNILEWDEFINALDENPLIFNQINEIVSDTQKIEKMLEQEITDEKGKKSKKK